MANIDINTNIPILDHLLQSMAFHGGFSLIIKAQGDLNIDAHHVVEDIGIVFGDVLNSIIREFGSVERFGYAVIPMDEALSEVDIDVCGRSTCVFNAQFPQTHIGTFDLSLLREFFTALANRAKISLHATIRTGQNSHHMAESLFKALGKALFLAYEPKKQDNKDMSTKGTTL